MHLIPNSYKTLMGLLIGVACLTGGAAAQTTVYVDGSVAVTGDGTIGSPFKLIDEALDVVDLNDDLTVKIMGGVYADEPADNPILTGQKLIGSYDSTFTTSSLELHPTTIDMARLAPVDQDRVFRIQQGRENWLIENIAMKNSSSGTGADTDNGGAIYIQNGSTGIIRGCSFVNCTADFEGGSAGGPARDGGAIAIRDGSTIVIEDCFFDGCTAVGNGGAILMRSGSNNVMITRSWFSNCGARGAGSAIRDNEANGTTIISNSIFVNNGVTLNLTGGGTADSSAVIEVRGMAGNIHNCTIANNNAPLSNLINLNDGSDAAAGKELINNIIAFNTVQSGSAIIGYAAGFNDTTTESNNLFHENTDGSTTLDALDPAGVSIIGTSGNITGDPNFVSPVSSDYHLLDGSPGIDGGTLIATLTVDFYGNHRPTGAAYDIGAIEVDDDSGVPEPPNAASHWTLF